MSQQQNYFLNLDCTVVFTEITNKHLKVDRIVNQYLKCHQAVAVKEGADQPTGSYRSPKRELIYTSISLGMFDLFVENTDIKL